MTHAGRISRRGLLAAAAAEAMTLASARAAPTGPQPEEPLPPLPMVDTHQHLWDLSRLKLPWLAGAGHLNRSYLMDDYRRATAGLNLVKAVYMEVDVVAQQKQAEAEWILDICRRKDSPTCAAVIGGLVGTEEFPAYIRRFKDNPYIKGVRHLLFRPETRGGRCLDPLFLTHIRLLGELGMRFDICIAAEELGDAIKLVDACPGTRFVLDHCGNADVKRFLASRHEEAARQYVEHWRRQIGQLAQRKNVVCKISGIVASARPGQWSAEDLAPIVRHCLESFGPDRVMFGGDWPVCTRAATFRQWAAALWAIVRDRPEDANRKLLADNAMRFYELG